jgi:inner membrane protein
MDNLAHSLVGLAAAKAGLERVSPYATAVCVVAANLPDADIVALAGGSLTYLKHHRGITHSIVGTVALGVALPLVFYYGERLLARVRGRQARARLGGLMVASLVVTATHPLLDWTNSYGLRPFLPWSRRWYYGDLVFVIDPWMWLALGGACFLLTARTARRTAAWAAAGVAVTAAVMFAAPRPDLQIPLAPRLVWLAFLACVVLAHRLGAGKRFGKSVALAALAAVVVYWGALAFIHARALRAAEAFAAFVAGEEGAAVTRVAAMPLPMNPLRWSCIAETERATYRYELGPWSFMLGDVETISERYKPAGEEAALARRAAEDPRAAVFLDFARFPVWQFSREGEGRTMVRITDVRFGEPPGEDRGGGNFTVEVPVLTP